VLSLKTATIKPDFSFEQHIGLSGANPRDKKAWPSALAKVPKRKWERMEPQKLNKCVYEGYPDTDALFMENSGKN